MHTSNPWTVFVAFQSWHGVPYTMGEEWTGGAGWDPAPSTLHQASPRSYASLGDGRFWFGRNFVYVQDNVLPNVASNTTAFRAQQDVEVMDWPDINSIGPLWDQKGVWIRHGWLCQNCGVLSSGLELQFSQEVWKPSWRIVSISRLKPATTTSWACSSIRWRHNGSNSVSNQPPHDCLLNRLFRSRSTKTSKLRVTGRKCFHLMASSCLPSKGSHKVLVVWRHGCKDATQIHKKYVHMPLYHYLNAVFFHRGIALILIL